MPPTTTQSDTWSEIIALARVRFDCALADSLVDAVGQVMRDRPELSQAYETETLGGVRKAAPADYLSRTTALALKRLALNKILLPTDRRTLTQAINRTPSTAVAKSTLDDYSHGTQPPIDRAGVSAADVEAARTQLAQHIEGWKRTHPDSSAAEAFSAVAAAYPALYATYSQYARVVVLPSQTYGPHVMIDAGPGVLKSADGQPLSWEQQTQHWDAHPDEYARYRGASRTAPRAKGEAIP